MAVDIKNLLEIVQKRINNLDSSTVTLQELIDIANFTDKASEGTLTFVDDSSDLPNLLSPSTPTAESQKQLIFVKNSGRLFVKKDTWKPFTFRGLIPPSGPSFVYGGTTTGFRAGLISVPTWTYSDAISSFPFASDTPFASWGSLTVANGSNAGWSTTTHGYTAGGYGPAVPGDNSKIDKFSMSSPGNASTTANLPLGRGQGVAHHNDTNGYLSGGSSGSSYSFKFVFSSDTTNATTVPALAIPLNFNNRSPQVSTTHGYTSGGAPFSNTIEKFPFASEDAWSDVGDLTVGGRKSSGMSSDTHGYNAGGQIPPHPTIGNDINKFPFASDTNATDVASLTTAAAGNTGVSSTTNGYSLGGWTLNPGYNNISTSDKFPFSSETSVSNVFSNTGGGEAAGHQV